MGEYKDVSVIIKDLTAMKRLYDAICLDAMIKALEEAPAVDVVEVVRCKDCRYGDCVNAPGQVICEHDFAPREYKDRYGYCDWGRRKDTEPEPTKSQLRRMKIQREKEEM